MDQMVKLSRHKAVSSGKADGFGIVWRTEHELVSPTAAPMSSFSSEDIPAHSVISDEAS